MVTRATILPLRLQQRRCSSTVIATVRPAMTSAHSRKSWSAVLVMACFAVVRAGAAEKHLIPMQIPRDDHDPLYIEGQTIRWQGAIVRFRYVLDVPILGEAGGVRGFRSNEIEGTIDCARRTFMVGTVTAYSGVAATGEQTGGYTPKPGEMPPSAIDERKGSTSGYLFRFLCSRRPDSPPLSPRP
jgi:hypothetical protein